MSERRSPCEIKEGRFVEPCTTLAECVSGSAFDRQKGVIEWNYIDISKHKLSRRFYGLRCGAHAAKGIAFNWCPFCGTRIDAPFYEPEDACADDLQRKAGA